MLGMAIQKGEKVHLIGACPKAGYETCMAFMLGEK